MPAYLIAEKGPHKGLIFNFETGDEWLIGRDIDACDFVLEDTTVSRKAAKLTKTDKGIFLHNLSRTNPILINGEEHEKPTLLQEGDHVQIGKHVFIYSEKPLPQAEKKKKDTQNAFDDIFGDLETPPEMDESEIETEKNIPEPIEIEASSTETPYDTIFEDLEEEGEIPYHLLQPAALVLKVISGPNAGAEIGIEKGKSYTIGKDPNSNDIVFQDLSVSRNHAKLSVNADGVIEIEDLQSKNGTSVNGELITEKKVITPQDLISLGTTAFLIIDQEAPQETIFSPLVPAYELQRTPAPAFEEKPAASWKDFPIKTPYLVGAGSFLLVFSIVFLSFFSLFKSEKIEITYKEPVETIAESLEKFPDVQFSFNPGSAKLFLVGHVLTSIDFQEMVFRIQEISFIQDVENNVVIDELVWKSVNDILNENPNWRGVNIHSPTAGKFVISGYVETAEEASELADYLTVNFPYLDRLTNRVAIENVLSSEIQGMFISHGFGSVTFQLVGSELIVSGTYSEKKADDFEKIIKEINRIHGISRIKNTAVAVKASQAGIDISQNFQFGGFSTHDEKGYSVVLNGKIYTIGDRVDGMEITSIGEKNIFLEKDGLKYKIGYR